MLRYPKTAHSIQFDGDSMNFRKKYMETGIEDLSVDFFHKDILRIEELEEIKQNGDGGSKRKKTADESEQKSMNPEEFTEEMERELETLLQKVPECSPRGEKLIRALERFRLENKRKLEEHGLHTLFLAIGRVRWKQPMAGKRSSQNATDEYDYEAPLILLPVNLETKKRPEKHTELTLDSSQYDPQFNPVLSLMLEREYETKRIDAPEDSEGLLAKYKVLLKKVEEAFQEVKIKHEVEDGVWLRMYSFHGQQIFEDLRKNGQGMLSHEFIKALCEGEALPKPNGQSLGVELDAVDQCLTKENDFTVLDADSSQLEVIHRIKAGHHLVVTGPPGTGKSQTIANAIASLAAQGKSVLFVCEKQAALKVVFNQLKGVGLGRICIPLYDHAADKKVFAKQIVQDYQDITNGHAKMGQNAEIDSVMTKRMQRVRQLSEYAKALLQNREPLGRMVYWVHGELAKHQAKTEKSLSWYPENISELTYDDYLANCSLLQQLAEVLEVHSKRATHSWRPVKRTAFSPDFLERVKLTLGKLDESISQIVVLINKIEKLPHWVKLLSVADIKRAFGSPELFKANSQLSLLLQTGISSADLQGFLAKCVEVEDVVAHYQRHIAEAQKVFTIPKDWKFTEYKFDHLGKESVIDAVLNWNSESADLLDVLDDIEKLATDVTNGSGVNIFNQSYDEAVSLSPIFTFANELKGIEGWHSLSVLKGLQEATELICKLEGEVTEKEDLLQKYGVLEEDLDRKKLQQIEQRFRAGYQTWLRHFSSQYRQDCAAITGYCSLEAPKKHGKMRGLTLALSESERSKKYLDKCLQEFAAKHLKKSLSRGDLQTLKIALHESVRLMEERGLHELPMDCRHMIEKCRKKTLLPELAEKLAALHSLEESIKAIVPIANAGKAPLVQRITFLRTLKQQAEDVVSLYTNVSLHIEGEKLPTVLSELLSDASQLRTLFELKERIEALDFSQELGTKAPTSEQILEKPDAVLKYKDYAASINCTFPSMQSVVQAEEFQGTLQLLGKASTEVAKKLSSISNLQKILRDLFASDEGMELIEKMTFSECRKVLASMRDDAVGLDEWTRYKRALEQIEERGFQDIVKEIDEQNIQGNELVSCYVKTLWNAWLEQLYRADKVLSEFDPVLHTKYIEEFKRLEKLVRTYNVTRIYQAQKPAMQTAMTGMRKEAQRLIKESQKERHPPIRKVLGYTAPLVQQLKPCWLMSPLTLSSFLPYESLRFDVVIFDEASQIRVEHALGAIARSRQVVVIGDPNQLPPTSFFDTGIEEESDAEEDAEGETVGEKAGYESLIQAAATVLPHSDMLLMYHYRSKHEKLIAFSNHHIYDSRLITFPAPITHDVSVEFVHVANGIYDGGKDGTRRNDIEATHVAEMCLEHARTYGASKSLGVIAFSKGQEVAIRDALSLKLKESPEFAEVLDENNPDLRGFFIKNLESVQGDERETIILSICYGRDKNGNVFNRFGPINQSGGYRRLNVAVTRASEKMYCVSSIRAVDISPAQNNRGGILLQKYLAYAEDGIETLQGNRIGNGEPDGEEESSFETEVKRALQGRGYEVKSQHGVSGFRIDLVIVHPDNPNMYILAVECDGATYHTTKSARDRDRLRQEILMRLGWEVYRVWSQHWLWAKEEIIEDIVKTVESQRSKKHVSKSL